MWRQIIFLGKEGGGGLRSPVAVLQFIVHFSSRLPPVHIFEPTYPSHPTTCPLSFTCLPLSLSLSICTYAHAHYFPPKMHLFILFDLWFLNACMRVIIIIMHAVRDESLLHCPSGIERTRQIQGIGPGGIRIQPIALDEWQAGREEFD